MRVAIISKTFVMGTSQRQLEWIARQPGVELTLITPPEWHMDDGRVWPFASVFTDGYAVRKLPLRFNGHFHHYAYRGLGEALREIKPDLIHVDEEPYNFAGAQAQRAASRLGVPSVFVALQSIYRRYPPPYSTFERYVYRRAAHVISVNSDVEAVIRRKGYSGPTSVFYVFGIDPTIAHPQPRTEPATGDLVIGYLGRLLLDKGLAVLLDALALLPATCRVRLIGSGPDEAALRAHAENVGVAARVEFAGAVATDQVPAALANVDALVLPSLTRHNWKEQFGRVLIEAMACDVPVVGSDSGEIPKVIGDAGLIAPEGNAQALAQALQSLAERPEQRAELARRGRERVLRLFTQEQVARNIVGVWEQALERRTQAVM